MNQTTKTMSKKGIDFYQELLQEQERNLQRIMGVTDHRRDAFSMLVERRRKEKKIENLQLPAHGLKEVIND